MISIKKNQKGGHFDRDPSMEGILDLVHHKGYIWTGSSDEDFMIRSWNIDTGKKAHPDIQIDTDENKLYSDGNDLWVYSGGSNIITRINTDTMMRIIYHIPIIKSVGNFIVIDNKIFITTYTIDSEIKKKLFCYDCSTGELKRNTAHNNRIIRIDIDDDKNIWSSSLDGTIKKWDPNTLTGNTVSPLRIIELDTENQRMGSALNCYKDYILCYCIQFGLNKQTYNIHLYNRNTGVLLNTFTYKTTDKHITKNTFRYEPEPIYNFVFKKDSDPLVFFTHQESTITKYWIKDDKIINLDTVGNTTSDGGIWDYICIGEYLYLGGNDRTIERVKIPLSTEEAKKFTLPRNHPMVVQATQHTKQRNQRDRFHAALSPQNRRALNAIWDNSPNQCQGQQQLGGSKIKQTHKHKGRQYTVRDGSHGGKYIRVSGKKIYI